MERSTQASRTRRWRAPAFVAAALLVDLLLSSTPQGPSYVPLLPVGVGLGVGLVAALPSRRGLPALALLLVGVAIAGRGGGPESALLTAELTIVVIISLAGGWALRKPFAAAERGQLDLVLVALTRLLPVTLGAAAVGAALSEPTGWSDFGWAFADWSLAIGASTTVLTRLTYDMLRPPAARSPPRSRKPAWYAVWSVILLTALGGVSGAFFALTPNAGERLEYLVGPLMLLLILECSQREIRAHAALIAVVAAAAFGLGHGPFGEVAGLHLFIVVSSLLVFVGGATLHERSSAHAALAHRAHHDALTELPNRSLLADRLRVAATSGSGLVAALMIDLDGFKDVNDRLGHDAGDALLKETGARLLANTRGSDTVARLGGDEFAVLLLDLAEAEEANASAARILDALSAPVEVNSTILSVRASIGIAVALGHSPAAATLLADADIALFAAKQRGKGRSVRFEPPMRTALVERLELRRMLSEALDGHQLSVSYQPIFSASTGAVHGLEALVRWKHSELGWISPEAFVDVAENSGLIGEMGRFVLEQAVAKLAWWQHEYPDQVADWTLAVNISPRQLNDAELPTFLGACLALHGVDPASIVLELTENSLLVDFDQAVQSLGQLRNLGVRIALDDYGSGHASVSYLRRLPVDILKIDRTLVAELRHASRAERAYVESLLSLARALDLSVVAEGVETDAELQALREMGCELVQGYLLSRPLTVTMVEDRLRRHLPFSVPAVVAEPAVDLTEAPLPVAAGHHDR